MHLLDSSAIIELLSGSERGKNIAKAVENETTISSVFCVHEVLAGSKGKENIRARIFFDQIQVYGFTRKSAEKSIEIEKELRNSGKMLGRTDIFIAAICKEQSLTLVTCDKGFKAIKGIKVICIE